MNVEDLTDNRNISIVTSSIRDKIEEEKCVVAQYKTTIEQKKNFLKHLSTCDKKNIPVEWVIDIADESNGWFYGTAYHYNDTTQMLHVMVPDKENPTFDGILLDIIIILYYITYHFVGYPIYINILYINNIYIYILTMYTYILGEVLLDHRTVHLVECVDNKTDALFNKIVRDSVIKVKWDVEWFEESEDGTGTRLLAIYIIYMWLYSLYGYGVK